MSFGGGLDAGLSAGVSASIGIGGSSGSGDPALVHRFTVEIDGVDLGAFTSCEGLQATYGLDALYEGGSLQPSAQLVKNVTYSDVKLQRPLDKTSAGIAAWFTAFGSQPVAPTTAMIAALDPSGATVCAWNLQGVVPKQWSGPQWASEQNAVAKETLVLAHTGFTLAGASLSLSVSLGAGASISAGIGVNAGASIGASAGIGGQL